MKINSFKILYSTTIPIQSYGVNDKIAVEMEYQPEMVGPFGTEKELFDIEVLVRQQKEQLDAIVAKLYPNRYQYPFANPESEMLFNSLMEEKQRSSTHEETRIGDIINDIKSCKDLTILSSYKLIAKTKPEFQEAYDEMFNKLSNQSK